MRERRLSRFHATHSYWAVLAAIAVDFVFASLAPDGAWATSVLVLAQTTILVLALWTAGWHVTDSRLTLGLVTVGSVAAVANLLSGGRVATGVVGLVAGILTIAILRFRTMPLPAALANQEWAQRLHRMDTGIPYGIALALAALMIYPDTPWMKSLGM